MSETQPRPLATDLGELPLISIVVPTLNEEGHIEALIESVARQTYRGEWELIVADGGSTDRTREVVQALSERYPWLRLIDNPGRTQARAFKKGVHESRGVAIGYVGAHSELAEDYLEQVVQALKESGAAAVGGVWTPVAEGFQSRAIAAAMDTPFGVGPARFKDGDEACYSSYVLYGTYLREALDVVGGINETLAVNEDFELNYRLSQAGYRLYRSPKIRITYYSRATFRRLARQYFRYGFWKAKVVRLHPASTSWWHMIAPLFVLGLLAGLPVALLGTPWHWLYWGPLAAYGLMLVAFALLVGFRRSLAFVPLVPLVFLILHLTWGTGFWCGAWHWWLGSGARGNHDDAAAVAEPNGGS